MKNPFSNRVCVDSSDYILKKKRLAKIEHLKSSKYANYKTSTYHVTSNNYKPTMLKKGIYPQEPKFVPNPILSFNPIEVHHLNLQQYGDFKVSSKSFDNYDKLSYESPSYNELYDGQYDKLNKPNINDISEKCPEKYTNFFNPKCKKCSNDLAEMKEPPEEWYCDGWDPPNTHCVGGNNIKLGKTDKAYCCPNVEHCNWILCEKCYISIGKKNKTLYCEPCEKEEEDEGEYKPSDIEIQERIEMEAQIMLKDKIEGMRRCAPSLKCIKSYEEYLDLAKGFHLTEPFCENTYQNDCLNINNGKLVENISEGRYSVIDMGKDCLYEENGFEYPKGICENKVLYKDFKVDKSRKEKGLLNLRATVLPKLKTERIFKFPLTIKKTHFCSNGVDKMSHEPVNLTSNEKHIRWVPTRNTFIKFRPPPHPRHAGSEKRRALPTYQKNAQLQGDMSEKGKRRVLDLTEEGRKPKVKIGDMINHPYLSYRPPLNQHCQVCNSRDHINCKKVRDDARNDLNNRIFKYKIR